MWSRRKFWLFCPDMPSNSLKQWLSTQAEELDEIENAHALVGGRDPGRKYATQQMNQAYVTLLSSHFQGFCRNLHSECVDYVLNLIPVDLRALIRDQFIRGRQLDRGNPSPGAIGSDFDRFRLNFWEEVRNEHA